MQLIPFDPDRDFDKIRDWITDEKTHTMWCGKNFACPLEKTNFIEVFSGIVQRFGDVPLLAVSDEGDAEGFFSYSVDPEAKECLLKFVVVKPECRGKGVAREMLRQAVAFAFENTDAEAVQLNVFLENVRAKKCYENVGFTERSTVYNAYPYRDECWGKCNMIIRKNPSAE